ncbi:MAG: hypothetical protein DRG24_00975 [Epsilonproteobacteria bacterium]|nr:MAG: hypothetical protein DRG24_00975 [Campylobacterota bacterium]
MRWRDIKKNSTVSTTQNSTQKTEVRYAGFWSRVMGITTDIFIIGLPISILMMILFGHDQMESAGALDVLMHTEAAQTNAPNPIASILQIILWMAITVTLWHRTGQSPGMKMAQIKIIDAKTLKAASLSKLIIRFVGYLISTISLIGFFIGLFRKDKRALHDLISGTAVIYE